jgi:flagellar assembly factor FliW
VKIETTRFGPLEIDEEKIITMPSGMLGFPERRRFVLFRHKDDSPFYWYQSVDDPALAFVMTSPSLIVADYNPELKEAFEMMAWNDQGDRQRYEIYVVVNIPKGAPEKMTVNLIGPILINPAAREAVQMVVTSSPYSHRFPLLTPSAGEQSSERSGAPSPQPSPSILGERAG